jgi:hypothetical protein
MNHDVTFSARLRVYGTRCLSVSCEIPSSSSQGNQLQPARATNMDVRPAMRQAMQLPGQIQGHATAASSHG